MDAPRIVSASRRTDIPAYYGGWLLRRIEEGFVQVRNPFNPSQVRRVSLAPADVDAIVFWTRDFTPLAPHYRLLEQRGLRCAILWTITGYPRTLEPGGIPRDRAIEGFTRTAALTGPARIAWRYDPIIVTAELTPRWHIDNFEYIASRLAGHTSTVIVSFMARYPFAARRLAQAGVSYDEAPLLCPDVREMAGELARIAKSCGMEIQACCHGGSLAPWGIPDGACIDGLRLSDALGVTLAPARDKGQRRECLCARSVDIGAYDTCPRGCLYCYATKSENAARAFPESFNPGSESMR